MSRNDSFAKLAAMAEPQSLLIEGLDYYKENDKWVFTAEYLKRRGTCCWQGCRHCPYRGPEADEASF